MSWSNMGPWRVQPRPTRPHLPHSCCRVEQGQTLALILPVHPMLLPL